MRTHLLTFNDTVGTKQNLLAFLDATPQVLNWYTAFPHAIVIVAEEDAHALAAIIHARYPLSWFLVTEITAAQANGWLPKEGWDFISNPRSSAR